MQLVLCINAYIKGFRELHKQHAVSHELLNHCHFEASEFILSVF